MKRLLLRFLRSFWAPPIVAGALLGAAFPPLDLGPLAALGWAVLLASMRVRKGERSGRQGFVFGLVLFVPGLSWIAPLVTGGWLFTAFWCTLHEALFGWLLSRLWLREERPGWILAAAPLHVFADLIRTYSLTGFPWLLTGYAGWHDPVLLGGAGLFGVHGATLAIVWLGAGLAGLTLRSMEGRPGRLRALAPAAAGWAVLAAYAGFAVPPSEHQPGPAVALLQANVPQRLKEQILEQEGSDTDLREWWDQHLADWWGRHADLLEQVRNGDERVDVVIWPETMVPPLPDRPHRDPARSRRLWLRLAHLSGDALTLAGVLRSDDLGRQWNSVVLIDREGRVLGAQDKQHRTPGGEYIPMLDLVPFRDELVAALKEKAGFLPDLQAGEGPELLPLRYDGGEARAGVLICYESIFPELGREMVLEGADFLVNASNYGWFEGTAEMDQALAMAVFRAAELGVSVVLASNNGHSVIIGPTGELREAVQDADGRRTDVAGLVIARVPLGGRSTPFRLWGEGAGWMMGVLTLLWGVVGRLRRGHRRPSP
jgi:apolipoprotein N-acyltransferase